MTDLADLEWRFVAAEARDGPTNMALDEAAAVTAAEDGLATVRIYRWEPSTLSLGYNQDPATVDWGYCEREGITVTRRPTGGGAIYHDERGDVSYSIVVPAEAVPGDLMECYDLLCEPVLAAFERMGVDASFTDTERPPVYQPACYLRALHPAHDVVGPDGRKVSGNAQYRQRDAVVQHGSLTFATTPERHCACFTGEGPTDQSPDPVAFAERVSGIDEYVDLERAAAVETLATTLAEWAGLDPETAGRGTALNHAETGADSDDRNSPWTPDELAAAERLVDERFGADPWVRRGEKPD